LVVGGGFIGLEVAACARTLGCEVTVLEAGERLAARALPAPLSARLLMLHRSRGVDVRLQARISDFVLSDDGDQVRLQGGEYLAYDQVVVGIGIHLNIELAAAAGLATGTGIRVDEQLCSSAEDIYAIGDVCEHRCQVTGGWTHAETWRNAEDKAAYLAAHFMGAQGDYRALGGFWSDQYDHGLQLAGTLDGAAQVVERKGEQGAQLLCGLDVTGRPLGVAGMGRGTSIARDIKLMERLIGLGQPVCPRHLADPAASLKTLLRSSDAA
jgi:3-phenylpropionate/trans-cinnamate dioxygenase ferredoxin reductase subunit